MKTIKIKTESGEWKEIPISDESFENIEKESIPEFKVGDWVIGLENYSPSSPSRIKSIKGEDYYTIFDDGYPDHIINPVDNIPYVRHCTKKEIEKHLIEEAEKRGYKDGVKVRCLRITDDIDYLIMKNIEYFGRSSNDDALIVKGQNIPRMVIYFKGKWAEIIEPKNRVQLTDEYEGVISSNGSHVKVGCVTVPFVRVEELYKKMKKLQK